MPKKLDTGKIWKAVLADAEFTSGMPESAHAPFRELVDALPAALEGHLDKPVTLASLMEAKLVMVEHMLDTGFVEKFIAALPEDALPASPGEMAAMLKDGFRTMRMPLMEMIHNTAAFLRQTGMTERQILAHPKGGHFSAATLKAYDDGALTLRTLLETQPWTLLKNGE